MGCWETHAGLSYGNRSFTRLSRSPDSYAEYVASEARAFGGVASAADHARDDQYRPTLDSRCFYRGRPRTSLLCPASPRDLIWRLFLDYAFNHSLVAANLGKAH